MDDLFQIEMTVIMPVYNAEEYIKSAVDSILSQTFTDFEFIIINDGSTDKSKEILEQYATSDPRIRLVSRENKGLVASLNEGINLTKGSLIARMDADDISLPERLRIQKEFLDNNSDVICVGSTVRVIDNKGRYLINTSPKLTHDEIVKSALDGVSPIIHPSAMIRTEAIRAIGGYKKENHPAEDLALWLDLSEYGQLANLEDVLFNYRIHDSSISTSQHKKQLTKTIEICKRACLNRNIEFDMKTKVGRSQETRSSKYDITLRHGWWAFKSKQWKTSAIYALKSIKWNPFKEGGWKLLFCSYFRRT